MYVNRYAENIISKPYLTCKRAITADLLEQLATENRSIECKLMSSLGHWVQEGELTSAPIIRRFHDIYALHQKAFKATILLNTHIFAVIQNI